MASASFEAPVHYGCLSAVAGVAALAVPQDVVEKFGQAQPVSSGCASIE